MVHHRQRRRRATLAGWRTETTNGGNFGYDPAYEVYAAFVDTGVGVRGGEKWVVPSMTTYNVSFDYRFDLWSTNSRIRLGINNFTDERAPLADRYFGYFADAHRDLGRYFYLDLRMGF